MCEGRVGFHLWLFLVGRLNPFHQKTTDESARREVRMGTVLPRWLCEEGRSQICGLLWLQEARSFHCRRGH